LYGEAGNVLYVAYLTMARAGVAALQFYNVDAAKWGQAHVGSSLFFDKKYANVNLNSDASPPRYPEGLLV
jgi:hypothetical protein